MKKFVLSSLAAFCMLSVSAQDELCAVPVHMAENSTANLVINLKNEKYIRGIQFAVILPEGFDTSRGKKTMSVGSDFTYLDRADDVDAIVAVCQRKAITGGIQISFAGGPAIDAEADVDKVVAGDGGIISFPIKTTAAAGVYPISVRVDELSDSEGNLYVKETTYTSYIVVGDAKGEYAAKNVLPAVVNKALETDANITGLDLSGVTALNGEFAYTVGKAVTAPAITADVKVVAPTSGTYGSLCSPVALPGVNCFVYNESKSSSTTAVFDPATDVPANTPVIINAAVNATVAGATLASVANGTAPAGSCYVAPDGSELRRTSAEINVPALRGTWNIAASSNLRIAIDTPTGLQFIGTADEVLGNTYDLQGRQVEKAQNGVYVVNGKKQFVK